MLINGEPRRCLESTDRGLQYGDGVFSTLAVRQGLPLMLDRHLGRLRSDAGRLGIPFPDHALISQETRTLAASWPESVIKIILTRGSGGRGYRSPEPCLPTRIIQAFPWPTYPASHWEEGVRTRICTFRLSLSQAFAGMKHLNRLEQVMARAEWQDDDIHEGLLLDQEGFVVEGVMSNLFLVTAGRLRTPRLDRCGVAGVMRGLVMEAAQALELPVEEARVLPVEVLGADELFLTNSVIGIWPVNACESRRFGPGAVTGRLVAQVAAMLG